MDFILKAAWIFLISKWLKLNFRCSGVPRIIGLKALFGLVNSVIFILRDSRKWFDMRRRFTSYLLFTLLLMPFGGFAQTGVSINSSGAAPDAQAILDISSSTKGVQLPRLTTAQATTLAGSLNAGDDGMIIYDTDLKAFKYWDGSLLQWVQVGTGAGSASTLDEAYDGGGAGLGRTIDADAGNVELQGAGFLTVESNVGIGTTVPAEKLEIQVSGRGGMLLEGDNTQDIFIQMTNDVAGSNYIYTDQSDGNFLKLESGSGKDIEFLTDGANERMAVQSDGRVRVNNLADPSSAVVLSNPAGVLGKTPLTGDATDVLLGTGVFGPASDFADDDWYQTMSNNQPTSISDWIYTEGRVGIGVGASANPSAPLQVAAAGSGNPASNSILAANPTNSAGNDAIITARVAGSSAGDPFFSLDISGEAGWSMGIDNDHDNRLKIAPSWNNLSSGTAMTVKTDGNVGIGTTDPDQKLQVQGIARSRGTYMIDVDGANGSGPRIAWGTTADVYAMMNLGSYAGINNLETKNRDFRLGSNAAFNAFYLQNGSGNIGIGTNTPSYKLAVQGSNSVTSPILGLQSGNNTLDFNNGAQIAFGYNGTDDFQHFIHTRHNSANSNNAIDFYVSNGTQNNSVTSGSVHTMSLVSGNVGVGTTSPGQKLQVNGTGRFTSLNGSGDRVVYANNNGDLITSSSNINPNSLIDGTGTLNYLARWTPDGNTLGIGTTYDNGTNVGIGTTSPGEKLHVNGNLRVAGTAINSGSDNLKMMHGGGRANDTSYEWVGFYSGTTRQGIILYDGAWTGANNSTDEFSITAENNNKLTLNTTNDHIALMPDGNYNVGVGTMAPAAKLEVDGGTNTELRVESDDNGASTISAYGVGQGTGRLYVGQSSTYGGGIEYNGDNSPATTGAGADRITLYRRANGTDYWTARNYYNNNDWEFREDVDVNGYLTVGNPNTSSTVKKAKLTFVDGGNHTRYNGTGDYNFTWNMGQLNIPPGASSVTVKSITYHMTGYRDDSDESIAILAKIGGNTTGWTLTSSWTFGGGVDTYYDWNFAAENLNWNFTSNQTVQFRLVEENETCLFCSNDEFTLHNIEVTVYYEYTTSPQAGTILSEGRIYANSTKEVGDLAEYFEVGEAAEVGDVVSLIPGKDNEYKLTDKAYDPHVVGVVSKDPSVVLNDPNVGPPVGLAGRVVVRLVPGLKPIESGDFITSSHIPGRAMKATKPGTVVGYAVENQEPNSDMVEILLQPGRFYYPVFDASEEELNKPGRSVETNGKIQDSIRE